MILEWGEITILSTILWCCIKLKDDSLVNILNKKTRLKNGHNKLGLLHVQNM